jgi:hypothetical protein
MEDFSDSKYYEEEFSSVFDDSPPSTSPVMSFDDSNDSMGLSVAERAYIWSIEWAELGGRMTQRGGTHRRNPRRMRNPRRRTPRRRSAAEAATGAVLVSAQMVVAATSVTRAATTTTLVAMCHRHK